MGSPLQIVADLMINTPNAKKSVVTLAEALERDGAALSERVAGKRDSERHRELMRHIIGIERWGVRRLRTTLGEPLVIDEYDGYRPTTETTLAELIATFRATRAETVALARQLDADSAGRIPHNLLGNLTVRGWLGYLNLHATMESRKMF